MCLNKGVIIRHTNVHIIQRELSKSLTWYNSFYLHSKQINKLFSTYAQFYLMMWPGKQTQLDIFTLKTRYWILIYLLLPLNIGLYYIYCYHLILDNFMHPFLTFFMHFVISEHWAGKREPSVPL